MKPPSLQRFNSCKKKASVRSLWPIQVLKERSRFISKAGTDTPSADNPRRCGAGREVLSPRTNKSKNTKRLEFEEVLMVPDL